MKEKRIALVLCALLLSAWPLRAQKEPDSGRESCLRFVQSFYDWYVAEVFKDLKEHKVPWHSALKYKGNPFSQELTRALIASDAEAKVDGDPVLDFDPILNTQDPAERYVVQNVTYKNGHYWAEIHGVWSEPAPDNKPQVVAELTFQDNRWSIVNFHYPDSPDDVNLLKILRAHYQPKR
jgi:hypothetical protein